MAVEKSPKRRIKPVESVRERAQKSVKTETKPRRLSATAEKAKKPIIAARNIGRREYHPIKLPDNKLGNFLGKSRRFTPGFLRNAWNELRMVVWPTGRETLRLSMAVFIFAIVFGAAIAGVDFLLEKLFQEVLL